MLKDKLHVIHCPDHIAMQLWETSVQHLWEWLKSQQIYKPTSESNLQGLSQWHNHPQLSNQVHSLAKGWVNWGHIGGIAWWKAGLHTPGAFNKVMCGLVWVNWEMSVRDGQLNSSRSFGTWHGTCGNTKMVPCTSPKMHNKLLWRAAWMMQFKPCMLRGHGSYPEMSCTSCTAGWSPAGLSLSSKITMAGIHGIGQHPKGTPWSCTLFAGTWLFAWVPAEEESTPGIKW